jgi:hypothetical protein
MSGRRLLGAAPEHHQFYRNTFKQLSDIQQRQVGTILGAAVADAAVREFEWLEMYGDAGSLATQEFLSSSSSIEQDVTHESMKDLEIAFPPETLSHHLYIAKGGDDLDREARLVRLAATPLRHQSITGVMHHELLKVMMTARGAFELSDVADRWVAIASAHPEDFLANHATLEHILPILSPMACVYPWADDDALWEFSQPFAEFLLTPTPGACADGALPAAPGDGVGACLMAQSIVLRYLQSNPNPTRNAMLQCAAPGGEAILPHDILVLRNGRGGANTSSSSVLAGMIDAVRDSKCYAHGIRKAIRLCAAQTKTATPPVASRKFCGPAMFAGALLGAKFGVRGIPMEWLSATRDHSALGTIAVDISQWSWNPPSK